MTEERIFGSLKCIVSNENGDDFVKNKFTVTAKDGAYKASMVISYGMLKDHGTHKHIEETLLKKLKDAKLRS